MSTGGAAGRSSAIDVIVKIVAGVIIVVVATFIVDYFQNRGPSIDNSFEFQFGSSVDSENPVYEVTQSILESEEDAFGSFDVVVSSRYKGDDVRGPVIVRILKADGVTEDIAEWKDFHLEKDQSKEFPLTSAQLEEYSGIDRAPQAYSIGNGVTLEDISSTFDIQVVRGDDYVLAAKTVSVVNTPWFHTVHLDDSSLTKDQPTTLHLSVRNHGYPAQFSSKILVHKATEGDASTLEHGDEGWWPGRTWAFQRSERQVSQGIVDTGEEYVFTHVLSADTFEEGNYYILESFITKELSHLDFPDGDWITSEDAWKARSLPHYSAIVVLRP